MTLFRNAVSDSLSTLKNQNYRTYVLGQFISLIGTFMQQVAQQWFIWDVTHDSRWIGIIGACAVAPVFFIGPFAGSIADRLDRRKLLITTQIIEMLLAFALGAMILLGLREVWPVIIFALVLGTCGAFTYPAQSAFIGDLSGMGGIRKAMAFYVTLLEVGRLVGPALAGLVVAYVGTGVAFLLNGLSFIAVIYSLLIVRAQQTRKAADGNPLRGFVEAIGYIRQNPRVADLLKCSALVMLFIFSSLQMASPIASTVLNRGAEMVGFMMAASGAGALIGAIFITPQLQRALHPGRAISLMMIWSGAWLMIASTFTTEYLAVLGVFMYSIGIPVVFGNVNALNQFLAPPTMRARLISIGQMVTFGTQPLGVLMTGWLANALGPLMAIRVNGILLTLFALLLLARTDFRKWIVERAPSEPMPTENLLEEINHAAS
jgi:MFS family permease